MTLLCIICRVPLSTARILNILKAQTNSFSITKKERKSALQTTNGKKRERRKRRRTTVLLLRLLRMSLWTLLQSVLLVANAFAVLNEERFLEPKNLSQSAITSGYVSAHGFKGQLIGLIYAASYLRIVFSPRGERDRDLRESLVRLTRS